MALCKKCFKEIERRGFSYLLNPRITLCSACYKEFAPRFYHFKSSGVPCEAVYRYDETIRENLYLLKGCYDIELSKIFLERFSLELLFRYHSYVIVPIPSSYEDDLAREFNHVEEIFYFFRKRMNKVLYKKYRMKQSSLKKEDRKKIKDVFAIKDGVSFKGKKVLIIDDVYTTGSSFDAACALLRRKGAKKICGLFLSKNIAENHKNSSFYTKKEDIKQYMRHFSALRKIKK